MPLNRTPPASPSAPLADIEDEYNKTDNLPSLRQHSSEPDIPSLAAALNVTERKKRKRDGDLNITTVLKDMFVAFSKEQEKNFLQLKSVIENLKEQNTELKMSVEMMSHKYDDFVTQIKVLEQGRKEDKKLIAQLEDRIEYMERKSKATGLEMKNIPKMENETKDDLCEVVSNLGKTMNLDIDTSNIKDIYRITTKNDPKPIIVEFNSVILRDKILKQLKNFNRNKKKEEKLNTSHLKFKHPICPVYVTETLTSRTQKLFYQARALQKTQGFNFCWISHGVVYLRKNEKSSQIRVITEGDLHKISCKMICDCDYILPSNKDWEPHYQNCTTVWSKTHNTKSLKNEDGTLRLQNEYLVKLDNDILYHLGLDTQNYDLPKMFGDVKFVCMGGTKYRMREFAEHIAKNVLKKSVDLVNLTKHSHRYAMFKVGPVLSVNHGIGIPSMAVLLQEIIKLLSYAKAKDPIIFRMGTSGGLNLPPGSVVISSWAMNGSLKKSYDIPIMGKMHRFDSTFDTRLNQELYHLAKEEKSFLTMVGGTMAADDFYRGQARLDGPFCHYNESDKLHFLRKLESLGVKNIEMEATGFAAMTREAGLRSADLCVTFVDRLVDDQVTPSKAQLLEWQKRPMFLIARYISAYLKK